MPERLCCAECFGDNHLRNDIPVRFPRPPGRCDYCGVESASRAAPEELGDLFEALIEIYVPSADGSPLIPLLRRDWHLFTGPVMSSDAAAEELLVDIMGHRGAVNTLFSRSMGSAVPGFARWDNLRDEIMHDNRWFLTESIQYDRLAGHFSQLEVDPSDLSSKWYRARVVDEESFDVSKMGAPPATKATHGRANPPGIRYLYVGSSLDTAVSEIRPHTGDVVCVAEFAVGNKKVVDLRNPRSMISPFPFVLDDDQIRQVYADLPVLVRLGEELTRPVRPSSAPYEYAPSQYLCEFIKHSRYDGVVYASSVSDGVNLALFRPDDFVANNVEQYDVSKVNLAVSPRS